MVLLGCDVLGMDATIQNVAPNLNQINLIGHIPQIFEEKSLEA